MDEGSPCERKNCDGKLKLVEVIHRDIYVQDQQRMAHQQCYVYQCKECGLRHSVEGFK